VAGEVRLHEHPDFAAFVTATAAELDLSEQFVEKDYWITEILRTIADMLPDRAIFKGGTSLSKGWGLIDRFSEDIDLFVNPDVAPPLSKRGVDRALKELSAGVVAIGGLVLVESQTYKGFGRIDTFSYESRYPRIAGFPPTVRLEPGVQSGSQPTEVVDISSLVGDLLRKRGVIEELGTERLHPFPMTLLHFRRTFVEKLFAIHGKVERLKQDGHPIGRDARHYADIHALAARDEVLTMLRSDEYQTIREDYDRNSKAFFPKTYRPPDDLRFARSDALFPTGELRVLIEPDYERECARLFFRSHAPFDAVLERLEALRELL
jgi:hypothetical protein